MDSQGFKEFNIASNLSEDDLKHITELENSMSGKTNNKIVLIAYQNADGAQS